jgi:hypothetical protein
MMSAYNYWALERRKYLKIHKFNADYTYMIYCMRKAGFYEFKILDHSSMDKYCRWCYDNYPDDYVGIDNMIFFTNKNIAILMRLSIE